jgi:PAS domain S-box-containing protein
LLQKQLRDSQERYRTMFEEVPCFISIQDRDLRIVEANRRFREAFGDAPGCKCYEVYKHRGKACVPCAVQQTFEDGEVHECEEVVAARDGRQINVLVSTAPIRNSRGEIRYVMEMSADITQIRELQDQLASLGLLIGSISHGIKGLLTGMDGGIYLVNTALETNDQDRLRKGWEMVRRNVSRVKNMVLDILYYAKGRDPEWQPISARALLDEVQALVARKAEDHEIEIRRSDGAEDGEFEGDHKAVRSLLVDLIENSLDACRIDKKKAARYVAIGFRRQDEHIEFEVADNGIGMDREAREKAFTLFFSSKGLEGTGLGLFIANRVAEAHGGKIRLESEPDIGSRFVVTLPKKHPKPAPGAEKKQTAGTG